MFEAAFPEWAGKPVGARIVDGPWPAARAAGPCQGERETPGHGADGASGDHEALVAGIDLGGVVDAARDFGAKQCAHGLGRAGQAIEIADAPGSPLVP